MKIALIIFVIVSICEAVGLIGLIFYTLKLKGLFSNSNKEKKRMKAKIIELNNLVDKIQDQSVNKENQRLDLRKKIQELEAENKKLLVKYSQLSEENSQKIKEIQEWKSQYNLLDKKIEKLDEQKTPNIQNIAVISEKDTIPEPYIPDEPEKVNPLFRDGKYKDELDKLLDVSIIDNYLKKSNYEKADMYLRLLKTYVEELEDVFENINADEDEIATVCIDKFARCFEQYFANAIIESSTRGIKEDSFYSELMKIVYKYMKENNIYSKKVTVGDKYKNMPYMNNRPKKTLDPSMHKCIEQVLSLPFYARYTNEYGKNKEKLLCKGDCVVLTAR